MHLNCYLCRVLDEFRTYITKEDLIPDGRSILLGVSGGVDSMVMANLFIRAGINFGIAHCNFQLRNKESDEDESFVKKFANQNNIHFYARSFDTKGFARDNKISIQMAARKLRLDWFEEIRARNGYESYASAHHLDDQNETFFINLLRGTGIAGLHGILPRVGNLIHPMLFATRKQILQYTSTYNISYRTDSSNQKTDYLRNKIRHIVLPGLEEIRPGFGETMNKNISNLRLTENIYRSQVENIASQLIMHTAGGIRIDKQKVMDLPHGEAYLFEFLSPYGFNTSTSEQVFHSLNGIPGKTFKSDGHFLLVDRDYIFVNRRSDGQKSIDAYLIEQNTPMLKQPMELEISHIEKSIEFQIEASSNVGYFDETQLQYPLMIRKWQQGDVFYPLGMNHRKKISDFFIDQKFSILDKEACWLLLSGTHIIWIMGHRIDDRYKITPATKNILKIRISPPSNI